MLTIVAGCGRHVQGLSGSKTGWALTSRAFEQPATLPPLVAAVWFVIGLLIGWAS